MKGFLVSIIFFMTTSAFGHGEDKAGPHAGHIRMPGGFHTELVIKDTKVQVYLLDMEFKNPTVKNSSVEVVLTQSGKTMKLTCAPSGKYFECLGAPNLKSGQLSVIAMREKAKASMEAKYDLPLKKLKTESEGHSMSH